MDSIETLTLENIDRATRDELRAFAKVEKLSGYTTLKVDGLRELVRIELERSEHAHKVIDRIADEHEADERRMMPVTQAEFEHAADNDAFASFARPLIPASWFQRWAGKSEQTTRQSWNQVKRRQRRRLGRKAGGR